MDTKAVTPKEIPELRKHQESESKKYITPFFNDCVGHINKVVRTTYWGDKDNITAEVPHIMWHKYDKLIRKDAYGIYEDLVKFYENAGWHVFSSTGGHKMFYLTLTPQDIWDNKNKK